MNSWHLASSSPFPRHCDHLTYHDSVSGDVSTSTGLNVAQGKCYERSAACTSIVYVVGFNPIEVYQMKSLKAREKLIKMR
jgi:hypothetical protein